MGEKIQDAGNYLIMQEAGNYLIMQEAGNYLMNKQKLFFTFGYFVTLGKNGIGYFGIGYYGIGYYVLTPIRW